jgi:hypothetical protein
VTRTLNTKVVEQVTLYNISKADKGFIQGIEQEQHAMLAKNLMPMNRNRIHSKAFFTKNFFEFQMPINSKVVCLDILHIFSFA